MTPLEQELAPLVTRLLDGELSETEMQRLATLLEEHAEARELYRRQIDAHSLLEWALTPSELAAPVPVEASRPPVTARRWLPRAAAIAACLLLALGALALVHHFRGPTDPVVAPKTEESRVARLLDGSQGRWVNSVVPGPDLRRGQTLELVDGIAALTFGKGERVILEAPCRLGIKNASVISLTNGKLSVSAPRGEGGFTIESPGGQVVERGADFGMQVTADGSMEIHVFTGVVEARPVAGDAPERPMVALKANESLRIDADSGKLHRALAEPKRFAKTANDRLVSVRLKSWYALGPLGHPRLKDRPADWKIPPVGSKEIRDYNRLFGMFANSYRSGFYPMDPDAKGIIDLDAAYKGSLTQDVAGIEHEVRWVKRDLDRDPVAYPPGEKMAKAVGLAYFSTWVRVPKDTAAEIEFLGYGPEPHGSTRLGVLVACFVRGRPLRSYRIHVGNPMVMHPVDQQPIELKQGWNHVLCRHASAWEGIRNDVRLRVPGEIADALEVSAEPPKDVGRRFRSDGTPAGKG